MEAKTVPVLDDKVIEEELKRMEEAHPGFTFDRSLAFDSSCGCEEGEVFDFEPDESIIPLDVDLPEVEEMRAACASGDLTSVQSIFKHWNDRPSRERIEKNILGASGLCEAIKFDNAIIGSYLLSHLISMEEGHFAMATKYRSYSILQLYLDRGWNINTPLGQDTPPALSGGSIEHGQLLHFAAKRVLPDRIKVLEYLLDKGASINERDLGHKTGGKWWSNSTRRAYDRCCFVPEFADELPIKILVYSDGGRVRPIEGLDGRIGGSRSIRATDNV
ncbi:MAG: hypothetical protein Q9163_003348 [Psora crenata]